MAGIREVVARLEQQDQPFPDILLIDGGKGQLGAALSALSALQADPPTLDAGPVAVSGRPTPRQIAPSVYTGTSAAFG